MSWEPDRSTWPRAVVEPFSPEPGRRVLVVSDIHGNLPLLKGALEKARFTPEDELIVLGDILERSETSLDTLRYVMELSRTHRVHCVLGNCDNLVLAFVDETPDMPEPAFQRWFARLGERATVVKMAHLVGARVDSPADYPAARKAIQAAFAPELAFLRAMPHILLGEDYLFVHGGVPREERLEELDAYGCMKNDDFLGQGHAFRRWVIVGHWPVTLYHPDIPSAAPIILPDRHIVSIDGGCTLKADGQVNVLILPEKPDGAFTHVAYDGFPVERALADQAPSADPINIRWGRSDLEVLAQGPVLSRCRHLESGRELDILNEYIYREPDGRVWCEDSTDYRLPVQAGERLDIVRRIPGGALAKKHGETGWYLGPLGPVEETGAERGKKGGKT